MAKSKVGTMPEACPICGERHEAGRGLSYDGIGVNSCGMYRQRIATLPEPYRHLGPTMAAAPDLLQALEELVARCDGAEGVRADGSNIQTMRAHAAIAKARGEA